MDPLSEVLSLLKPKNYATGGFGLNGDLGIQWPKHPGIKCYAMLSGQCWLSVQGVAEPVLLSSGDCLVLPRGLPFSLTTDLALTPVDFETFRRLWKEGNLISNREPASRYMMVGGHFILSGNHADMLLQSLPPIVHIRKESDKAAMRWSLDRLGEELRDPQPGGALIAQQLAYVMLVQALRLHFAAGVKGGVGWLFALADKQIGAAIACIHDAPGHPWTLRGLAERAGMSRSVFAWRFKQTVGQTPMEYLTRWRMLVAGDRLTNESASVAEIAFSLGYDSESAFGKAFKRVIGCSPKQYSRGAGVTPDPTSNGATYNAEPELAAAR